MSTGEKSQVPKKRAAPAPAPLNDKEKVTKIQRRWTHEEVEALFSYLIETTEKNFVIEKPNALIYYGNLITAKSLVNCTPPVVRDKVRHLQSKYKDALKWRNETGQGVRESDGDKTFEETFHQKFPYFKLAETVWGSKASIHVPFTMTTGQIGELPEHSLALVNAADDKVALVNGINHVNNAVIIEEMESQVEENNQTVTVAIPQRNLSPGVDAATAKLLNRGNRGFSGRGRGSAGLGVSNSREAYLEATKMRSANELEKLNVQKQQLELQQQKQDSEMNLQKEKFEFEKYQWQAEYDLRQMEILKKNEVQMKELETQVRLKELEVEKLKLEVELKKYK